jgi:hypothetical protein
MEPVDISFGGLRIYSDEAYVVGAYVRLDVFFPRVAPATFTAKVMWIKTSGKGAPGRFEVGLAFVDLTPESIDLLHPLLEQGPESANPTESSAQVAPRMNSSVEFISNEPVTEIRPKTPEPASQGRNIRLMLSRTPVLVAGVEHLRAAQLDGWAGFVLSLIDGVTTVANLLELSGMAADVTLAILEDLRQRGIIELR